MRVQQRETAAVVEPAIEVDGLDTQVKDVEQRQELHEDITGGLASV